MADKPAITPMHVSDDVDYWRERAIRAKRLAQHHDDQATRDHLMKIAAGYEELADRAEDPLRAMRPSYIRTLIIGQPDT